MRLLPRDVARVAHLGERRRGFTLIEVLLAIVIVAGLLGVVLFFYQQASSLRAELLQEADRISAARLLMDRLTTELRVARTHSYFSTPLLGDASSIQFITVGLPAASAWAGDSLGRASRPETDLKYVRYTAEQSGDGTNVIGIARSEEPLVEFQTAIDTSTIVSTTTSTNRTRATLLTDQLHALRFRYWNGTAWQDSWNETRLPAAVEVTVAREAIAEETQEAEGFGAMAEAFGSPEPTEDVFRRVIYLPGSTAAAASAAEPPLSDESTASSPEGEPPL